jgi:hypothetical protein
MKKKEHNGKRTKKEVPEEKKPVEDNTSADANQEQVDETMVKHLQTTLSMLEERKVSRSEVVELIKRMRQRSIDNDKQVRYLGGERKNKPG